VRYPTFIGYVLIAPLVYGLGVPANPLFPGLSISDGKIVYISMMVSIGVVINLVTGGAVVECTSESLIAIHVIHNRLLTTSDPVIQLSLMRLQPKAREYLAQMVHIQDYIPCQVWYTWLERLLAPRCQGS
jgi:hypothetical protein